LAARGRRLALSILERARPQANDQIALEAYFAPLRYERRDEPLAGPVAMMTSGYVTAAVAATVAFSAWITAMEIARSDESKSWRDRLDLNHDGSVDGRDEGRSRAMARGFATVGAIGLGMGVAGTWLLVKRLNAERERTDARRLSFGASASSRGFTLSLRRGF
jgi:hypothetical protein